MRLIPDDALATATIWAEARGEPQEGRIAVAEVIHHRAQLHYNSDGTIAGTVAKALQFSCWNDHDPQRVILLQLDDDDPVVQECAAAWRTALAGSTLAKGALLYMNPDTVGIRPPWVANSVEVARIGRHVFYVPR